MLRPIPPGRKKVTGLRRKKIGFKLFGNPSDYLAYTFA
jgi:hypothetical protein